MSRAWGGWMDTDKFDSGKVTEVRDQDHVALL